MAVADGKTYQGTNGAFQTLDVLREGDDRRKIVRRGRSITFQMAEVMVPRALLQKILRFIAA